MKILYIHHKNMLEITANNVQVVSMCKAFSFYKHEITLLVPCFENKSSFVTLLREKWHLNEENIYIETYKNYNLKSVILSTLFNLKLFFCFAPKERLLQYDFIFTRQIGTYLMARKFAKKIIYEIHNNYFFNNKIINNFLIKQLNSNKYIKNTLFVCISNKLADFWKNKIFNSDIIACHDGFDELYFVDNIEKSEAREKIGLSKDLKIATYVGSMRPDREIEKIIETAFKSPEYLFILIGGPEEFLVTLKQMAEKRNICNVMFLGYIPHCEVSDYLFASDVLLALWSDKVVTINYCSPLKIFEYMAAGRIIIAHDYPTIREVLTHKKNCFLIKPNNTDTLTDTLNEVLKLNMEKKQLIENNARLLAFSEYSWKKRTQNILNHLNFQHE